nr:hypothetical protein [Mesorhizobium sp.]
MAAIEAERCSRHRAQCLSGSPRGEVDAETARSTFVAFARRMDLLVPAAGDIVAANAVGAFGIASGGHYNKSM